MAWKENLSQEEYDADIETATNTAKEGLFTQEQLDTEIGKTKDLFKEYISKEDFEKAKGEYETTIKDLEQYKPKDKSETEIELEKIKAENKIYKAKEILQNESLPSQLMDIDFEKLHSENEEDRKQVVESLKELFADEKFNNSFKPTGHKKNDGEMTKEQFENMSYKERMNLFKTNPNLFNTLNN
ncbi:hypothetical protein [Clostridium brassicae]|uniref:DUF4355 domain-containing protein n=1 Tax=Clostridium brassicae TaxID=2999072 RepID=A0ABT4D7L5_9CLOT|nr:hypothetical protein [Clostridium brassicae]MCY6958289.1 hypothetical protein [Clostridium brassicae]